MAAEVNPIMKEGVQLRIRDLIIVVLCFCLAMCHYDRDEKKPTLKWPLAQLILMSAFAYIVAHCVSDSKVILHSSFALINKR
jgi:hypothetical protein